MVLIMCLKKSLSHEKTCLGSNNGIFFSRIQLLKSQVFQKKHKMDLHPLIHDTYIYLTHFYKIK